MDKIHTIPYILKCLLWAFFIYKKGHSLIYPLPNPKTFQISPSLLYTYIWINLPYKKTLLYYLS